MGPRPWFSWCELGVAEGGLLAGPFLFQQGLRGPVARTCTGVYL